MTKQTTIVVIGSLRVKCKGPDTLKVSTISENGSILKGKNLPLANSFLFK